MPDTPTPTSSIAWPAKLLAKAIIKLGSTHSAPTTMATVTRLFDHNAYILSVLEAPLDIQVAVRNAAITGMAAGSLGQEQLAAILTMFLALSPAQKVSFIDAFKACGTLVGQGAVETVAHNSWQSGHVPPYSSP